MEDVSASAYPLNFPTQLGSGVATGAPAEPFSDKLVRVIATSITPTDKAPDPNHSYNIMAGANMELDLVVNIRERFEE